jgi:processive 1,2-diacylglycerol beta-glucosyltransferase
MPTLLRIDDHIRTIGEISDADVARLRGALEEDSVEDRDYYIDRATIDLLAARGARRELIQILLAALGTDDGMDVEWREGSPRVDAAEPKGPYR